MSTITQMTAVPADMIGAPPPAAQPADNDVKTSAPAATATSSTEDSQRLTISEGPEAGVLIYTILDRASGRVLLQIPRVEVEQIATRPDYTAGTVIDTTA